MKVIFFMIIICVSLSHAKSKTQAQPPASPSWISYLDPSYWMSGGTRARPLEQQRRRLRFGLLHRRMEEQNLHRRRGNNRRIDGQHPDVNRRLRLEPTSRRIEDFFYDYYDNNLDSTLRPPARPTPNCVCRCDCCDCCPCGEDDEFTYIDK